MAIIASAREIILTFEIVKLIVYKGTSASA